MLSLKTYFYLVLIYKFSSAANILILSTVPSLSHSIWNQNLGKILGDRNHQVTILDTGRLIVPHPNVTHIELSIPSDIFDIDYDYYSKETSSYSTLDLTLHLITISCKSMLDSPAAKSFLDKNKGSKLFDLIIMDGACCESFLGFVEAFNRPPLIFATAYSTATTFLQEFVGNYDNPTYVPHPTSLRHGEMNYLERMENSLFYLYYYYAYHYRHLNGQNELARSIFGENIGDMRDLANRAIVTLINTHPAIDGVKPQLPNTIPIGGFHIEQPQPLDKELQTFLDNSKTGVIYFSFGSNLQCSNIEEKKLLMFISVFKKMNLNVVWKCDKDFKNWPKNIYVGKWFKQNDVLAHPNVKVFISHGGLLGTQEAIYNGVPLLAIPFIVDQQFVAQRIEKMGIGLKMSYSDITEPKLEQALNKLFTDKSFQIKIKEISDAFRDNPIKPKELAIYWIEYVLRHPNTKLLRSPTASMPFYKILGLDLMASFILIIFLIIYTILGLIKCLTNPFKKEKLKKK